MLLQHIFIFFTIISCMNSEITVTKIGRNKFYLYNPTDGRNSYSCIINQRSPSFLFYKLRPIYFISFDMCREVKMRNETPFGIVNQELKGPCFFRNSVYPDKLKIDHSLFTDPTILPDRTLNAKECFICVGDNQIVIRGSKLNSIV